MAMEKQARACHLRPVFFTCLHFTCLHKASDTSMAVGQNQE
jgi:hypothetical protein